MVVWQGLRSMADILCPIPRGRAVPGPPCPDGDNPVPLACLSATDLCNGVDHGCEFKCVSTEGSYRCVCPEGQQLQADGKACSSEYRNMALSILLGWALQSWQGLTCS